MSITSVRLSKQEQVQQRRAAVLELSSQGLTQQEIADRLGPFHISQRTVSRDLEWLREDAVEYVKKNREHIAFDYKQAMSNFYQLRKEAWKHFSSTKNENVKTNLYGVIESINNNIMSLLAAGDMIELELLQKAREQAKETREDLDRTLESEAKF
jgi:DNA-binding transcriptional regulator LsrR (DeoR family)